MSSGDPIHPSVLGLCNPLLDVSAYVDQEILDKYKLKANDAILAGPDHTRLCQDLVDKYNVEYTAGGSAMNVMRVIAGIYQAQGIKGRTMFTGCIGQDKFGELMKKKAADDGVKANFSISDEPTGTCAVCLSDQGKNRSLCAFLGASQKFTEQHLKDNWKELVEETDLIYITGFLIAVSPATFHLLGEHIARQSDQKKKYCLNLSAAYVSQVFGTEIDKVLKYVDILFANDEEAKAFAEFKKYGTNDVESIAKKIAMEPKLRSNLERLVVITQGDKDIIVAQRSKPDDKEPAVRRFTVKPIPDAEIVDTNGAGDAFAGGFLSQVAIGEPLDACIDMGIFAAHQIIKVSGINFPKSIKVRPPTIKTIN